MKDNKFDRQYRNSPSTVETIRNDNLMSPEKSAGKSSSSNTKPNNNMLSWRSDPKLSFSDWTIQVIAVVDGSQVYSNLYHCHSNVLAWGPRKSDAFQQLFQQRMNETSSSATSKIAIPRDEAEVFPMLLDFMYCETTLPLSADRVCSIYLLSERFGNVMLMKAIQAFVEKSLTFEQSVEFLIYARDHKQRKSLEKLVLCANSKLCGYLVKCPKDASKVPPDLMVLLLQMRAQVIKVLKGEDPRKFSGEWEARRSRLMSEVVGVCCITAIRDESGDNTLTREIFQKLTNLNNLPFLSSSAALKILEVDEFLRRKEKVGSQVPTLEIQNTNLSALEAQCVRALVADWREIISSGNGVNVLGSLRQLNNNVLAQLLLLVSNLYEQRMASRGGSTHDILEQHQTNSAQRKVTRADAAPKKDHQKESRGPNSIVWSREAGDVREGIKNVDSGEEESLIYGDRYIVASD